MTENRSIQFNLRAEIDRYFDDASLSNGAEPRIVILTGGPASGKTTIRKQHYSTGYVLVDAADIFINLSRGEHFDFPGPFEQALDIIGPLIARKAITERRHIVTELIGADREPLDALMKALRSSGYRVEIHFVTCGIDEAVRRNLSRGENNISAFYAEHFQRAWLQDAAVALGKNK